MSELPAIPPGYLMDHKGRLVPESQVRDHEKLEDQTVLKIHGYAVDLAAQIGRFKGHSYADIGTYLDILGDKYGLTKRGAAGKGNITLTSFDGLRRVQVKMADQMAFGPGLQIAKGLVDECLRAWSADARPELKAIVEQAFQTDKAGLVNREAIFRLLRLDIEDETWQRAMEALRESIRIEGAKSYLQVQERADHDSKWETIAVDMARARIPEGMVESHLPTAAAEPEAAKTQEDAA